MTPPRSLLSVVNVDLSEFWGVALLGLKGADAVAHRSLDAKDGSTAPWRYLDVSNK